MNTENGKTFIGRVCNQFCFIYWY